MHRINHLEHQLRTSIEDAAYFSGNSTWNGGPIKYGSFAHNDVQNQLFEQLDNLMAAVRYFIKSNVDCKYGKDCLIKLSVP